MKELTDLYQNAKKNHLKSSMQVIKLISTFTQTGFNFCLHTMCVLQKDTLVISNVRE